LPEDIGRNISEVEAEMPEPENEPEYMIISLISRKIKVLLVGGGKAGFLKAKSYAGRGCNVVVVSKEFCDEFGQLSGLKNVELIKEPYDTRFILDKHLILIATGDQALNQRIREDCERNCKIYLDCDDFKQGLFVTPVQQRTDYLQVALHTLFGSPKTSKFLINRLRNEIKQYDEFAAFISSFRRGIKGRPDIAEIMDFMNSDDFYEFYLSGKHLLVLEMFYPELTEKADGKSLRMEK